MDRESRAMLYDWIRQAGDHIKTEMDEICVNEKSSRRDLVTDLDRWCENFFREKISQHFPEDRIIGEEDQGDQAQDLTGGVWLIDPIDGTMNFVMQRNNFCIMLAYYVDGQGQWGAIYDVMADDYFEACRGQGIFRNQVSFQPRFSDRSISDGLIAINEKTALKNIGGIQDLIDQARGLRIIGSAGLTILAILKGELVLYYSPLLKPWDMAAGLILAQEAGLAFTRKDGKPLRLLEDQGGLIAYPQAHREFIEFFQEA